MKNSEKEENGDSSSSDFSDDEDDLIKLSVDGDGKKRRKEPEDDGSEDDEGDVIDVDFDFFDPLPEDEMAVGVFLQNYIDADDWKPGPLAELIAKQAEVGSMIKSEDQLLGFISVVNLHKHKDAPVVQQLTKFLLARADAATRPKLQALLDDEKAPLGLLVHERMVNLPPQLVPSLHKCFLQDLDWATSDKNKDMTRAERAAFKFKNYLLLTRCIAVAEPKGAKKSKESKSSSSSTDTFLKFEDELYLERAELSFSFASKPKDVSSEMGKVPQRRILMAFQEAALRAVVKELEEMANE